jgi:hypothetical protein
MGAWFDVEVKFDSVCRCPCGLRLASVDEIL